MLRAFKVPVGWRELFKRTGNEVLSDNLLDLAAELAYYFFLALFPALLFLVAVISFVPVDNLMNTIMATLGRVAPGEVLSIVREQVLKIAEDKNGGLLTLGMLGTLWSVSSGVTAIITTMNQVYDIQEGRPWWRVRLIAVGLTIALTVFVVVSFVLVLVGPTLGEKVAVWFHLGPAFTLTWKTVQWPVVFALIATAIAIVFYYAPDAEQEWVWITPGSLLATALWVLVSLGFKLYVAKFATYNATYGAIGGVIVLMLWFYVSAFAILVGAELNAEIEHASPYGKDPGEKAPGEKKKIGLAAAKAWEERRARGETLGAGADASAPNKPNCDVDEELPHARPAPPAHDRPRASDWIVSGVVLSQMALVVWAKLRSRFKSIAE